MKFITYNKNTGEIISKGTCQKENLQAQVWSSDIGVLEVEGLEVEDTHKVVDGVIKEKTREEKQSHKINKENRRQQKNQRIQLRISDRSKKLTEIINDSRETAGTKLLAEIELERLK